MKGPSPMPKFSSVPDSWLPDSGAVRVIAHWSEGWNRANDVDKAAYHLLIEGDGKIIRGVHEISDNDNTADGDYAAHCLNCNRYSIGVSLCGMVNCRETPFSPGPAPITEVQWQHLARLTADLCIRYKIPVSPTTTLGHGEVQKNLGIKQRGKWDPLRLPWNPSLSYAEVGDLYRADVLALLEPRPQRSVQVAGKSITGGDVLVEDGSTWVALRAVSSLLGWTIISASAPEAVIQDNKGQSKLVPFQNEEGKGFVEVRGLASAVGLSATYDPAKKLVVVGSGQ